MKRLHSEPICAKLNMKTLEADYGTGIPPLDKQRDLRRTAYQLGENEVSYFINWNWTPV